MLRGLLSYVQGIAESDPANAEAIITSAGMSIRKTGAHVKGLLQVKAGRVFRIGCNLCQSSCIKSFVRMADERRYDQLERPAFYFTGENHHQRAYAFKDLLLSL